MVPEEEGNANSKFVDPDLSSYFSKERYQTRVIPVMIRPSGNRDKMVEVLQSSNAEDVRKIATESVRADIPVRNLKELMNTGQIEAVELVRPLRVFDQGN